MSQVQDAVRVHCRWFIRRDMPEVLDIEARSFDHVWTEDDFLAALRNRSTIGMVGELDDRVVSYMLYDLHPTKLHVLNFAVDMDWRRRGVGTQMVTKLIGKLSGHRRTKITLAVRESNLDAQRFWAAQDFVATRVLRGFYEDSKEDAYAFKFAIPSGQPDSSGCPRVDVGDVW
jgi:ribosomal-protein-alanine N-acetyltransferase